MNGTYEIERIKTKKTSRGSYSLGLRPSTRCNALRIALFVKQAGAANVRQGYVHDPVFEAANARYISGDITADLRRDAGALKARLIFDQ
ncbi:hypothetical protein CDO26_36775 (plasmid) [Sinorhizobium meliloti]|nr:hypothetical protein CDO26_36775 [Sinorhizobium meliloti]